MYYWRRVCVCVCVGVLFEARIGHERRDDDIYISVAMCIGKVSDHIHYFDIKEFIIDAIAPAPCMSLTVETRYLIFLMWLAFKSVVSVLRGGDQLWNFAFRVLGERKHRKSNFRTALNIRWNSCWMFSHLQISVSRVQSYTGAWALNHKLHSCAQYGYKDPWAERAYNCQWVCEPILWPHFVNIAVILLEQHIRLAQQNAQSDLSSVLWMSTCCFL